MSRRCRTRTLTSKIDLEQNATKWSWEIPCASPLEGLVLIVMSRPDRLEGACTVFTLLGSPEELLAMSLWYQRYFDALHDGPRGVAYLIGFLP